MNSLMIKVGPATTGKEGGSVWDEKGRCQIAKIFISHGDYFISSLQFMYFENDGRFVLSDLHGAGHNGHFSIVVLDYPSEYLTWISGTYYGNGLRSITFGTNKGSHGPYGSSVPHSSLAYKEFHFQIGDDVDSFGGFHGTKQYNRIEGIGVYVNTITSKDSAVNAKKSQVDDEHATKEDTERPLEETRQRKEKEEKEQKGKEEAEAHLYIAIKLARDEDLVEQVGKEIYFDLVDHNKVRSFRTQKQIPFTQFKEEVAREFGIPVQFQRFWLWAKRQNHTYRPYRPLTAQEEIQSVGQLREGANDAELNLYLECLDLQTFPPPGFANFPSKDILLFFKEDILLFFKLYDPLKEEIRYVGRLYVKGSSNPAEILTKLNELAGFSRNEEIELFEEIRVEPNVRCERINREQSFHDNELENGDIICFQKSLQNQGSEKCRFPEVPSFLEYIRNPQKIRDSMEKFNTSSIKRSRQRRL